MPRTHAHAPKTRKAPERACMASHPRHPAECSVPCRVTRRDALHPCPPVASSLQAPPRPPLLTSAWYVCTSGSVVEVAAAHAMSRTMGRAANGRPLPACSVLSTLARIPAGRAVIWLASLTHPRLLTRVDRTCEVAHACQKRLACNGRSERRWTVTHHPDAIVQRAHRKPCRTSKHRYTTQHVCGAAGAYRLKTRGAAGSRWLVLVTAVHIGETAVFRVQNAEYVGATWGGNDHVNFAQVERCPVFLHLPAWA